MNILIIGNGFDLAHGLPTKYSGFLNQLNDKSEFYEFIKVDMKSLIKKFNIVKNGKVAEYLISKLNENNGWIDFENEIREIIEDMCLLPTFFDKTYKTDGKHRETVFNFNNEILSELSAYMYNFFI